MGSIIRILKTTVSLLHLDSREERGEVEEIDDFLQNALETLESVNTELDLVEEGQ